MVDENEVTDDWRFAGLTVRFNLNKEQTYIGEDNNFPQGDVLNDSFCD